MSKKNIYLLGIIVSVLAIVAFIIVFMPKNGTLSVKSDQSKTKVTINKIDYLTPFEIKIIKGKYTFTATKDGFVNEDFTAQIKQGKKTEINLNMVSNDFIEPSVLNDKYLELEKATDKYEIIIPPSDISGEFDLQITLFAIDNAGVNGPPLDEQYANFIEQLKAYKKEALDYIGSQNVDPATLKIYWIPEEAKDL